MTSSGLLSRRRFLRDMGAALGVGLTNVGGLGLLGGCADPSTEVTGADWNALARLLPGRVLRPGASEFDEIATPWNLRWSDHRPRPEGYQNFIDDGLTDWRRAYYGENLERLVEIKRKYDPRNVFHNAQSIPLSI